MSALDELIQMDEQWEKDWPMEDFEIVIAEAKQDLAQLRKENEQLKEAHTWQPIESAPNNKLILLCWDYGSPIIGFRDGKQWKDDMDEEIESEPPHFWMPLPKPPEVEE